MRTSLVAVAAVLAVSTVSGLGCKRMAEKAEEKALERATGGQVQINDGKGSITITTDAGTATMGTTTKVPDDFPKAIAIYPGAKPLLAATSTDPKGKQVWSLQFETPDAKDKVVAYYKANMSGFTTASTLDMGQSSMYVFQSPKYDVTVTISGAGSKTGFTLNAATK